MGTVSQGYDSIPHDNCNFHGNTIGIGILLKRKTTTKIETIGRY